MLTTCRKCGGKVSDLAEFCPHCGFTAINPLQIEDKLLLGEFPQSNKNFTEPIVWTVINILDNKALLLSDCCLECIPYDNCSYGTCWSNSYIRKWLNNEFYNSAFSCEEQQCICQSKNNIDMSYPKREFSDDYCDIIDNIFMLSLKETEKYLSSFKAKATLFSKNNGVYCREDNYCSWWLRTHGNSAKANSVWPNGTFSNLRSVNDADIGVRPALWVDIEKLPKNSFITDEVDYNSIDLNEFQIERNVLVKFIGNATNVVIPRNVKEIASEAFEGCINIQTVIIPKTVTKIGERVFRYCSNLQNVVIPNSVTQIGSGSFVKCTALKKITMPQNIKNISMALFSGCNQLKRIVIPNNVEVIGSIAFINCSSLEHITMPYNLTTIRESTFANCSALKNIDIPKNTQTIGEKAFENCINLEKIIIPNGVTEIKYQTFYGCKNLKSITLPKEVRKIDLYAFAQCSKLSIFTSSGSYAEKYANKNNIISISDNDEEIWMRDAIIEQDCSEEVAYNTLFNDLETDIGPDDDMETYEYYYSDDE